MGPVSIHNGLYGWYFYATHNHVDGYGSWIRFRFMNSTNGPELAVDAFIVNDFYGNFLSFANEVYKKFADDNWKNFALNLNIIYLA